MIPRASRRVELICSARHCGRKTKRGEVMCRRDWRLVPDDLKERVRWAKDSEDHIELMAAVRAAADSVEESLAVMEQ